jgi:hypothetical protein
VWYSSGTANTCVEVTNVWLTGKLKYRGLYTNGRANTESNTLESVLCSSGSDHTRTNIIQGYYTRNKKHRDYSSGEVAITRFNKPLGIPGKIT